MNQRHIGLLVFDKCSMVDAGAIGEAFRLANEFACSNGGEPPYRLSLLSDSGGLVTSSSTIALNTQKLDTYALADFHALFAACDEVDATTVLGGRAHAWVSQQVGATSRCAQYSNREPGKDNHAPPVLVPVFWFRDLSLARWSSSVPPIDMALAQIERDLGADASSRIFRVLQPHVGQRIKVDLDGINARTTIQKIYESARWMKENYERSISVTQAADVAAMSPRNYQRRFRQEFGVTPLEYLIRARLEIVCNLLTDTDLPIDKIARRCGMGDGNRLGRLFKQRYEISPMHFRARLQIQKTDRRLMPVDDGDFMGTGPEAEDEQNQLFGKPNQVEVILQMSGDSA